MAAVEASNNSTTNQPAHAAASASAIAERLALRETNIAPERCRLTTAQFRNLKSDSKKASVFGRKFRAFTAENLPSIVSDLDTLNLTMFVTEAAQNAAACIAEGKIKSVDIPSFISALSLVHQKYEAFAAELTTQVAKIAMPIEDVTAEMKKKLDMSAPAVDLSKLRTMLRCLSDLWLVGLIPDVQGWLLKGVLLPLAQTLDAAPTHHHTTASLAVVQTVMRHVGPELCKGAIPGIAGDDAAAHATRLAAAAAVPAFPSDKEAAVAAKLFTTLTEKGLDLCRKLRKMTEEQYKKVCESTELRGEEGNAEALTKFTAVHGEVTKMIGSVDALAVALGRPGDAIGQPDLKRVVEVSGIDQQVVVTSRLKDFFTITDAEHINYYDDDDQQAFYEQLPSIEHLLASDQALAPQQIGEDEAEERTTLDYTAIDAVIAKLPQCAATKYADAFVEEFLCEASRYYRETGTGGLDQARAFFHNCRVRLSTELRYARTFAVEMLPFYSRIVATLSKHFPDVAENLVSKVNGDLLATVAGKVQNVKGKKRRAGRYIAELTKFRVCPPRNVLRILQVLTDDLDGENASVWASIIECVGSFLMRGNATKKACEEAIVAFKKKRNATSNIPTSVDDEIEMALNTVREALKPRSQYRPVEAAPQTPVERYLRHLVFKRLNPKTIEEVLGHVRRLPWTDPEENVMMANVLRQTHNCAWHHVHLLAEVIADVSDYHGWLGPAIADMVLEDLRLDLEQPEHRTAQRRLQDVKFLAELFNFRIVSASVALFALGQMILYFPHTSGPRDYSRIRAFCLIVECIARYLFPRKDKHPQHFIRVGFTMCLVHFFRYVHTRAKPIPHDIDFRMEEALRVIDATLNKKADSPKLQFPPNIAKADELIAQYGLLAVDRTDNAVNALCASFALFVSASQATVPSIPPADVVTINKQFGDGRKGCIYSVVKGRGRSVQSLTSDTGFASGSGPMSKPTDASLASGRDVDNDSSSSSSTSGSDDEDDDDDEEESSESDVDDDDSDEEEEDEEEPEEDEYKRAAPLRGGAFTTGGSGWLTGSARQGKASQVGLTAEEIQEQIDFDTSMKALVKDSLSEVTSKRAGAGLQQIERAIEQRLSGGNIAALARDAKVADSAKVVLEKASAPGAPAGGFTRMAVLRRGANDRAEARAVFVPPSEFTDRVRETQAAHAQEAAEARARTLAINKANEASVAAPPGGRAAGGARR